MFDLTNLKKEVIILYNQLYKLIKDNGGYICTIKPKEYEWSPIYAVEQLSEDVCEHQIIGLRTIGNYIFYYSEYDPFQEENVPMEELCGSCDWECLKADTDYYYLATLLNIINKIELYV